QYVSASGAKRQVCEPEGQAKGRLCLCEPFRQSQGTPLAAFFNIPILSDETFPSLLRREGSFNGRRFLEFHSWQV
ncbi:MAG: hypothetical protein O3A59_04490, partial [Nitrospirae bacterium]|nr:hypothetical protein [Nitrospirota bacterium]